MSVSRAWRADLHCHSSYSDGTLAPEQLAAELAAAGCRHASLTDHNTLAGSERFRLALERYGIQFISGVEVDADGPDGLLHLLAYGVNEDDPVLQRVLYAVRHPHTGRIRLAGRKPSPRIRPLAPGRGAMDSRDAIHLLQKAGGKVFLAHPLTLSQDLVHLEGCIQRLREQGLDGIEAHYKAYDRDTRQALVELAERQDLLCCGGSDYHGPGSGLGAATPGFDLPEQSWLAFSRALDLNGERAHVRSTTAPRQLRSFLLRIGLPAALAGLLFVLTIFQVLLPAMEEQLLERKKETIRELTRAATSIIQEVHDEALSGKIDSLSARAEAAERIRRMRYGPEGKDYFWITDMSPRMVMHPYREDLNGQSLQEFRDPAGNRVFVAFVEAVREQESGYVDYYWQWKDDSEHIAPKLSYVQAFRPWAWVIGTGLYTEDLQREIELVKGRLILASLLISAVVALLLFSVAKQSYRLELLRARAESALSDRSDKYQALVAAATEGTLLVLDKRCAYTNSVLDNMLGYGAGELAGRAVLDLLATDNLLDQSARDSLQALLDGEAAPECFEARLRRPNGSLVEVQLMATPVTFAGSEGIILVARDMRSSPLVADALERSRVHYRKLTTSIRMGVFRSRWEDGGAPLLEANPAMHGLLGLESDAAHGGIDWLARIVDPDLRKSIRTQLESRESLELECLSLRRDDGSQVNVRLFAVLVHEEDKLYCDGVLEDITVKARGEAEREELITQLQTSLFYLQEPIGPAVKQAPELPVDASVADAASLMTRMRSSALVVVTQDERPVGLVTDQDFRERVNARGIDPKRSLGEIMSAPLVTLSEHGLVHEAILEMQERGIGHLVVLDDRGRMKGLVRDRDLIQFRHYSAVILTHSIRNAHSVEDLRAAVARLPRLVQALLDSGARVRAISRITSRVADSVVQRLLEMAHEELGTSPVPYAFFTMGSEARREQTLLTDQDTGLIYADPPQDEAAVCETWFLKLGAWMSDRLDRVGYQKCPGGVMASNPQWNNSAHAWGQQFRNWIRTADPQELLDINIAFDLRCLSGDIELVQKLKANVFEEIAAHPPFLLHLARNALLHKAPLTMRGKINAGPEDTISLKEALLPVVNYGRLYALKHGIDETHTLDRLGRLHAIGRLSTDSWSELQPDYESVMRLRLSQQANALLSNRTPVNLVRLSELNTRDEAALKALFTLTEDLRKKISYDFLGMA